MLPPPTPYTPPIHSSTMPDPTTNKLPSFLEEVFPLAPPPSSSDTSDDPQSSPSVLPDNFGDIMSSRKIMISLPNHFEPLERVLLTANGNIQRIISAYYNSPVTVQIHKNNLIPSSSQTTTTYARRVTLHVLSHTFCTASSTIHISAPDLLDLITVKQVGIGQLFRYLNILPEFELVEAGKEGGKVWRRYVLRSRGVECFIHEVFCENVFGLVDKS
ncbi:hypothetical protein DFS34DRAFT_634669 [Phlyctochytrium arcticum]|nr:hypothetical protein DFS34DRAFT_634669 [Phlyctochytrium arcticum]